LTARCASTRATTRSRAWSPDGAEGSFFAEWLRRFAPREPGGTDQARGLRPPLSEDTAKQEILSNRERCHGGPVIIAG
jgi:hypothetical protein